MKSGLHRSARMASVQNHQLICPNISDLFTDGFIQRILLKCAAGQLRYPPAQFFAFGLQVGEHEFKPQGLFIHFLLGMD